MHTYHYKANSTNAISVKEELVVGYDRCIWQKLREIKATNKRSMRNHFLIYCTCFQPHFFVAL